jgi:uncharacterized protein YbbK (DUF523 family)
MGEPVRYDGKGKFFGHPLIDRWRDEGRLVVFCPELAGGFRVPRPPAEIAGAATGEEVLAGTARVVEITGGDVTEDFVQAAENAVALARQAGCRYALLIDGSPSCGSAFIYDGSFSGRRQAGNGVTAAALKAAGIEVFSDREIERLIERVAGPESGAAARA